MSAIHCSMRPSRAFSELTFHVANLVMAWSQTCFFGRRRCEARFARLPSSAESPSPTSSRRLLRRLRRLRRRAFFAAGDLLARSRGRLAGRLRCVAAAAFLAGDVAIFLAAAASRVAGSAAGTASAATFLAPRCASCGPAGSTATSAVGTRRVRAGRDRRCAATGRSCRRRASPPRPASSPRGRCAAAGCPSAASGT